MNREEVFTISSTASQPDVRGCLGEFGTATISDVDVFAYRGDSDRLWVNINDQGDVAELFISTEVAEALADALRFALPQR